MSHNMNNNPYAKAAGTYANQAQNNAGDQREQEARILLKANRQFQNILENWESTSSQEISEALTYNRQLWLLFYDTAIENKDSNRPNDLRSNIVNLANFIFKREMEIMADLTNAKKKFDILITINREIAAGLMTKTQEQSAPHTESPQLSGKTDIQG